MFSAAHPTGLVYAPTPASVAKRASPALFRCSEPLSEGLVRIPGPAPYHFIGDGGTVAGIDQGDNLESEEDLRDIHGVGYAAAIEAGAETVMASFSSWRGRKMHGFEELLTGVLKDRMGFDGFVVGDWNGHGQVTGCSNRSCAKAFMPE